MLQVSEGAVKKCKRIVKIPALPGLSVSFVKMQRKKIRLLAGVAGLVLLLLGAVQVYWFNQAFDREKAQWEEQVNLAMRSTANRLLVMQGDSISRIDPIRQVASNSFKIDLATSADYALTAAVMEEEFGMYHIDQAYQLTLRNCTTEELILGSLILPDLDGEVSENSFTCKGREQDIQCVQIAVLFPGIQGQLLGRMEIWLFSSLVFLLVLILAVLTLIYLLQNKRMQRLRTDFFNNMTHELKTPITNIGIASEVLANKADSLDSKRTAHYVDIIRQENEKLKQQAELVLQLSKLESNPEALPLETVDLHEVAQQAINHIMLRIEERGGRLMSSLKAEHTAIRGNQQHLMRAILNLLDNAEKYSLETLEITISSRNENNQVVLAVEDHGVGMSADVRSSIFDKFYRAPQGDRHEVSGFGLGLSYVRSVIQAHQAHIRVESSPGKGSRFELQFPQTA